MWMRWARHSDHRFDRHESPAHAFLEKSRECRLQIVAPNLTLEIPIEDLSHLSLAEQQRQVTAA